MDLRHIVAKYRYYAGSVVNLLVRFRAPLLMVRIFTRTAGEGTHTVQLTGTGESFVVRVPMDVWSIKETFIDRFYERYGFRLQPNWTIVDIGAAIGEFTVFAARASRGNRVLAFEPFPGSAALLRQNIGLNRLDNVQIFENAVSGVAGPIVLDLSGGDPLRFEVVDADGPPDPSRIVVEAITLADILSLAGRDRIDLLKLDCEGAEYDILMHAPHTVFASIDRIVMEYHDDITEFTHVDLTTFLQGVGYDVKSVKNEVHPDRIGYLWAWRSGT